MERLLAKCYIQNQDYNINFSNWQQKSNGNKKQGNNISNYSNVGNDKNPYNLCLQNSPFQEVK
jgi:hypothetical protein